jgi:hypothetical protein
MPTLSHRAHRWAVLVEHGVLRVLLMVSGIALVLPGLLLVSSVVFLPLGLFLALMGAGVIAWGVAGEPFEAQPARATAPAIQHTPWDCRWTVLGYRLINVSERDQPETPWICVRDPGRRRPVIEADCAHCPEWEPNPTPTRWPLRLAA